jgi:hypothetical protein
MFSSATLTESGEAWVVLQPPHDRTYELVVANDVDRAGDRTDLEILDAHWAPVPGAVPGTP